MSRWPSNRRTSVPSATFQIAATPPRPATPDAVTRRVPSAVKCKAVTLPGKLPERALRRRAAGRMPAVEADLVAPRATASHRPSRVASIATTGRTFACEGILGTTSARRSGSWPCGPACARVDPGLDQRDLVGSGPRLVLGRHHRLRRPGQETNDAAPLGVAGQERGAVRGPSLQRGVAFERELPLAILVVMAAGAVLLEDGSDARRVIRGRSAVGPGGRGRSQTRPPGSSSLDIGVSPSMVEQELPAAHQTPEHVLDDLGLGRSRPAAVAGRGAAAARSRSGTATGRPGRSRRPARRSTSPGAAAGAACRAGCPARAASRSSVSPLERCSTWTIVGSSDRSHSQTIRRGLRPNVWRK